MATVPHDWEVLIDCPQCGQRGRVTVSSLKTMVRCPACRSRVVVGREGVKKASREMILAGQTELLATQAAAAIGPQTPTEPLRVDKALPRSLVRSRAVVVLGLAVLLVALVTVGLRRSRPTSSDSLGLRDQASAFANALLVNDLDAAAQAAMVEPRELRAWWRARRATMTAGFGKHARGELGDLEINEQGSSAVVRLTVVVEDRTHAFTQDWERFPSGWKLQVGSSISSADRPRY